MWIKGNNHRPFSLFGSVDLDVRTCVSMIIYLLDSLAHFKWLMNLRSYVSYISLESEHSKDRDTLKTHFCPRCICSMRGQNEEKIYS